MVDTKKQFLFSFQMNLSLQVGCGSPLSCIQMWEATITLFSAALPQNFVLGIICFGVIILISLYLCSFWLARRRKENRFCFT